MNARVSEMQAAILRVKLPHLNAWLSRRREIADRYIAEIKNPKVTLPEYNNSKNHVFHAFVIRAENRGKLKTHLDSYGVQFLIHYPIPPHKQKAFKQFSALNLPITEGIHDTVLTLPMSPVMTEEEVTKVIDTLNAY